MSKQLKKLWIVSELFYPEEISTSYILTKIANRLCDKYSVSVICGPESYDSKKTRLNSLFILDERIRVFRSSTLNLNKNKLYSRVFRQLILSLKLTFEVVRFVKKGDKVFIVTNPAPLVLLVGIMKKVMNFDLTLLVHDVFPENLIPANIIKSDKSIGFKILKRVYDKMYSRADTLIVLGEDMKKIISQKIRQPQNKRIYIIQNWAEIDLIQPLSRTIWTSRNGYNPKNIYIQYAGNLGRVQGLMSWLSIIKQTNNPFLVFTFFGSGALENEMRFFVESNNLSQVKFLGDYSRINQNEILNSCDLSLVTLSEGMFGLGTPSKSYNIMAAGKPILFVGDEKTEIGLMVTANNIGYCFQSHEEKVIVNFLNQLRIENLDDFNEMGKMSRFFAENNYSEKNILNKFMEVI